MTTPAGDAPSRLRLDELLRQIVVRAQDVLANADRLQGLLNGVVSLAEELNPQELNERIVQVSRDVVSAASATMLPPSRTGQSEESLTPTRIRIPIEVRGAEVCRLELSEPLHVQGFSDDDLQLVRVVAAAASTALENTLAYAEEERRERWLQVSREISERILAGATRDEALHVVCERLLELADGTRCVAMLPVRREVLKVVAAAGDDAENILGTEWAYEESISAQSMRTGEVVVVEDLSAQPGGPARYEGWGRTVVVPLTISTSGKAGILSGEVLGVLTLARKAGAPPPPPDELELMSDFARQASLALEYTRAQDDRSQLAIFSDRDRIGRDLHDLVIQRIFAIGMTVNSMVDPSSDSTANKRMVAIVDDLDETIKDIRSTIHQLQNDQSGTDHRVQLRRAISEATPGLPESALKVDFVGDIATGIPEGQMPLIIDALTELLDNVMRHARASMVEVTVDVGATLRVVVVDDGIGIPAEEQRRVGLGRLGRLAESLGGALTLSEPEHGTGTVVVWQIPAGADG